MSQVYDIRLDVKEVEDALDQLHIDMRGKMAKKLLRALATIAKKRVRRRMGAYLNLNHLVGSLDFRAYGESLQKAVYGFARSPGHAVVSSGQMYKAEALEHGAVIHPVKRRYLYFRTEEGAVRARKVVIPAKRWFTRSLDGFESDPDYQGTIDKVLGKAIKDAGLGR